MSAWRPPPRNEPRGRPRAGRGGSPTRGTSGPPAAGAPPPHKRVVGAPPQRGPVSLDNRGQLRLHGRGPLDAEDLVKPVICIHDVASRIDLKETDRNCLGQPVQELLAGPELLLGGHLV